MIIANQTFWLKTVNECINLIIMPINFRNSLFILVVVQLIPVTVEPNTRNFTIVRKQFSQLLFHEVDITIPVTLRRSTSAFPRSTGFVLIVGPVPIQQRIEAEQFNSLAMTFIRQFFQRIALPCCIADLP